MRKQFNLVLVGTAIATLPLVAAHAAPADAAAGHGVYERQCSDCHGNQPGVDRFGPTLAGVYGRMAGTASRHRYSKAMADAHIVWNADTLDAFLKNPRADMRGTIMPYRGLVSATARAEVIAYLKSISPGA
jgi:cytochrome c